MVSRPRAERRTQWTPDHYHRLEHYRREWAQTQARVIREASQDARSRTIRPAPSDARSPHRKTGGR